MNITTAFTIFTKTAVREQRIPFEIALNTPNAQTIEAIEEVEQLKSDPHKKTYGSFAEIMREIDNV